MVSVDAVADYILGKINMDEGDSITNLKLQKVVYYCQAWHMALYDEPLFSERVEAWTHGPAVHSLYVRFKKYGCQAIDTSDIVTDPTVALDDRSRGHIDEVWDSYGHLSGSELRDLTHHEIPWQKARGKIPAGTPCNNQIDLEEMREFYTAQMQ